MNLKPQDIYILLKIVALGEGQWSYASVAGDLIMSASAVLAGMLLSSVASGHCPLYAILGIKKTI